MSYGTWGRTELPAHSLLPPQDVSLALLGQAVPFTWDILPSSLTGEALTLPRIPGKEEGRVSHNQSRQVFFYMLLLLL